MKKIAFTILTLIGIGLIVKAFTKKEKKPVQVNVEPEMRMTKEQFEEMIATIEAKFK